MALNEGPLGLPGKESASGRGASRSSLLRLGLRRLMLVVAVVALALGAARLWPQVQYRRAQARQHDRDAIHWQLIADSSAQRQVSVCREPINPAKRKYLEKMGYDAHRTYFYYCETDKYTPDHPQEEYRDELTAICRERSAYHERMARKWHWAAWLPWTDVAPGPPRPPVELHLTDTSFAQ